jgi:hypothetical protein
MIASGKMIYSYGGKFLEYYYDTLYSFDTGDLSSLMSIRELKVEYC